MSRTGLFITLDGPSGSGKSTIAASVHRILTDKGLRAVATREPTDSELGTIARHQHDEFSGLSLACLVAADRYDHLIKLVRPSLQDGAIVVSDRYVPSSFVLQRMDEVPLSFISDLNSYADPPDLSVILTADPDICAQRVARRGSHGRFHVSTSQSELEVRFYAESVQLLAELGWKIWTIDTAARGVQETAEMICAGIVEMTMRS